MMKQIFAAVFLIVTLLAFGQSESSISKIRRLYQQTQKDKKSYENRTVEDFEHSSEGGGVTVYLDDEKVRLVEAIYYGHMGKSSAEYYYKDGLVYFVFLKEFAYNAPPTQPDYDQEETTVKESRYYFWDDQLIRWIKPNGEYAAFNSEDFQKESAKISEIADEMLRMVEE